MFRRIARKLPEDPTFEDTLAGVGLQVTEDLQFVHITTGKHFENFVTDNEHHNAVRTEAGHAAARLVMMQQAVKEGMQEVYICGDGLQVEERKPTGPHVSILTTKLEELEKKDDVIVLVGEHTQDLGVFAYRSLMRTAGLNGASVVGLVKKIKTACGGDEGLADGETASTSNRAEQKAPATHAELETPGLVILNPGQLYYSHSLKKNMTLVSWLDRRRHLATDAVFQIDETHNRLQGHKSAEQHLAIMLDDVLPQILKADAKLYFIGISDGADGLVEFLDSRPELIEHGVVLAAALVQPACPPIKSEVLEEFLARYGRSWISSERPYGELVQIPEYSAKALNWDGISSTTGSTIGSPASISTNGSKNIPPIENVAIATILPPTTGDKAEELQESEKFKDITEPDPVLCPTFSSGSTNITELVFPAVMDEAVRFILGCIQQVHSKAKLAAAEQVEDGEEDADAEQGEDSERAEPAELVDFVEHVDSAGHIEGFERVEAIDKMEV